MQIKKAYLQLIADTPTPFPAVTSEDDIHRCYGGIIHISCQGRSSIPLPLSLPGKLPSFVMPPL